MAVNYNEMEKVFDTSQTDDQSGTYVVQKDGWISAVSRNGNSSGTVQIWISFNGQYTAAFHIIPNAGANATVSSGFIRVKMGDSVQYTLCGTGRKWLNFLGTR